MQKDLEKTILNIVENCGVGFLSTINLENIPETRALMNLRNKKYFNNYKNSYNGNLDIYFATDINSPKMEQIRKNNNVSLYFYLEENMQNMTLFGKAEIITDREILSDFWQDDWLMYYPEGKNDKSYSILRFTPKSYKFYMLANGDYKKLEGKI